MDTHLAYAVLWQFPNLSEHKLKLISGFVSFEGLNTSAVKYFMEVGCMVISFSTAAGS